MTTVADFAFFNDERFTLLHGSAGKVLTRELETPAGGEGAVLTWNVRRETDEPIVSYEVKVNKKVIANHFVISPEWTAVQEVLHTSDLKKDVNEVMFTVTLGTARLAIADVILWYRKNI